MQLIFFCTKKKIKLLRYQIKEFEIYKELSQLFGITSYLVRIKPVVVTEQIPEAYTEPSQTCKMEKIVKSF